MLQEEDIIYFATSLNKLKPHLQGTKNNSFQNHVGVAMLPE